MGLADIKARLAHIAGIESLTVEQTAGAEVYHLGGQTVEVPLGNAGIRNRVQFLAEGLTNKPTPTPEAFAKVDRAVAAITDPITAQVIIHKEITGKTMSITGIQSGTFQAKLAEMKQKMVDKQNQALSRIDGKVTEGHAKMDAAVDGVTAKMDKEVDDALHEFAQSTNGGPA